MGSPEKKAEVFIFNAKKIKKLVLITFYFHLKNLESLLSRQN